MNLNFFKKIGLIVWKDIIVEFRTKDLFSAMFLFSLLVVVIFNFAFAPGTENVSQLAPGILWVAFTFAGVLGLNRSFVFEKDSGSLQGLMLSPVDRGVIYLGKMIGNIIFIFLVELVSLPLFAVFFNLSLFHLIPRLALVLLVSTVGFASAGTLLAAISVNTKAREVLLPILLFPIIIPVIIGAVKSTGNILEGKPLVETLSWLKLLTAFDIIFIIVSFLVFEYVVEE
ncbi:MAG: ABC transporter permease [Nitrospirae bacterium]|nr:ABC transporter permease [Nitrospirota bacterium]